MSRLNLDAFKAQANQTQELESLTGGILGACHTQEDHDNKGEEWLKENHPVLWWLTN